MIEPRINGTTRRRRNLTDEQQTLGALLKATREARRMSRSKLLHKYHQEMEQLYPDYDDSEIRSEAWLARVERDEVYVSILALELLCRALDCKDSERVRLLKCADRIPFVTPAGETTVAADVLTFAMVCLHNDPQVRETIHTLMRDRRVLTLEKGDLFEIISEVIEMAKPKRRLGQRRDGVMQRDRGIQQPQGGQQ
jgi:transcriptional regulator with XRE-family HTH domain